MVSPPGRSPRSVAFPTPAPTGSPRPGPSPPWSGVRDAAAVGPAAPQPASRLERVMGGFQVPQAEQCLSLNVWAPPGDGHPVMVFLHGGGFTSGSGGSDWYDGAEPAAAGDRGDRQLPARCARLPATASGQ
ncbi:carboxylesterase family protein [Spirillospora sp. CA-255316]